MHVNYVHQVIIEFQIVHLKIIRLKDTTDSNEYLFYLTYSWICGNAH